ncbi:MAG: S8 family serine peptidase, partial [Planctomycetota bacterium]
NSCYGSPPEDQPDPDHSEVDITAPGTQIPTVMADGTGDEHPTLESGAPDGDQIDEYATYLYGTSFAAPHGAGVGALLYCLDQNMTAEKARCILRQTADDLGNAQLYGEGRLNAYRALLEANGQPSLPGDLNGDGAVDGEDVRVLADFLAGGVGANPECLMDVNADGSIDSADHTALEYHVMKKQGDLLVHPDCEAAGPGACP